MKKRTPVSLQEFIQNIDSEDWRAKEKGVIALRKKFEKTKDSIEKKAILQTLLRIAAQNSTDDNAFAQRNAVWALGQCGKNSEIDNVLINIIIQTQIDKQTGKSANFCLLWGEARELLKHRLEKFTDEKELMQLTEYNKGEIVYLAADALEKRAPQLETKKLITVARDSRFWVRKAAIIALKDREGPEVNKVLIKALKDLDDYSIRRHAINALASKQEPEVTQALIKEFNIQRPWLWTSHEGGGPEIHNKKLVIEILAKRDGEGIDEIFATAAKHEKAHIRNCATQAIEARAKRRQRCQKD